MLDFRADLKKKNQVITSFLLKKKVYFPVTSACGGPELLQMLQLHLVALRPVVRTETDLLELLIMKKNNSI